MSDIDLAPKSFRDESGRKYVFVDFQSARYEVTFDVASQSATATSTIEFTANEIGRPIFELRMPPDNIETTIDGNHVTCIDIAPDDGFNKPFKSIDCAVSADEHTLTVRHELTEVYAKPKPIDWTGGGVRCVFQMSDVFWNEYARFLGSYLPSNLEFDHFKMHFCFTLLGAVEEHILVTNRGVTQAATTNVWEWSFPEYFTTSFPWIHLLPKQSAEFAHAEWTLGQGRTVALLAYRPYPVDAPQLAAPPLAAFIEEARIGLDENEKRFGAFPYDHFTMLAMPKDFGGMEHAGATACELNSVRHEVNHCYFARCIAPCNGDAGWIDEAIAAWADKGYRRENCYPPSGHTGMLAQSPYSRITNRDAYVAGERLMAALDWHLADHNGLVAFLRAYFERQQFTSIDYEGFGAQLREHWRRHIGDMDSFEHLYNDFVVGTGTIILPAQTDMSAERHSPYHPKRTLQQSTQPFGLAATGESST